MHIPEPLQASLLPVSPLQALLARMRQAARNTTEIGTAFEELCIRYLRFAPENHNRYSSVQRYKDWAAQHGGPWGLGVTDIGIDLVATTPGGQHLAVQCKCYGHEHTVSKHELDSFLAASGNKAFSGRIFIVSTYKPFGPHAQKTIEKQHLEVSCISLHDLEQSHIDWAKYAITLPGQESLTTHARTQQATLFSEDLAHGYAAPEQPLPLKPRHQPRPHQQLAIDAVLQGLQTAERGKLIMACGTGKTLTALKIAEQQAGTGGNILFLVPSLALLAQTLKEWSQHSATPITAFAVCSDKDLSKKRPQQDNDALEMGLHDLAWPATTDAAALAREHAARHDKASAMSVVFATYHSIDVIFQAQQQGLPAFDLAICDEAHRTTGQTFASEESSAFVRIHDSHYIQAHKRLYMTATPRIFGSAKNASSSKNGAAAPLPTLYSMDNEAYYGRELHRLNFADAVEQDLLVPYQVVILGIAKSEILHIDQRWSKHSNHTYRVDDAALIVGCFKALAKVGENWPDERYHSPVQRAIAFCQIIGQDQHGNPIDPGKRVAARHIAETFNAVTAAYKDNPAGPEAVLGYEFQADFIHGGMKANERAEKLAWLRAPDIPRNECRVLTNVRCLAEGVDVPALDAVIFLSARQSQIDVVQSVGRVMRTSPGKKRGYIILPIVVDTSDCETPQQAEKIIQASSQWGAIWQTLAALRAHDEPGVGRTLEHMKLGEQGTEQHLFISMGRATPRPKVSADTHAQQTAVRSAQRNYSQSDDPTSTPATTPVQAPISTGALEQALTTLLIEKVSDATYWSRWSGDISRIAQRHIEHLNALLTQPGQAGEAARAAFSQFSAQLRQHVNPQLQQADIVEMLAQHLITNPVLDALLGSSDFNQHNPVSRALQSISHTLLENPQLHQQRQQLQGFYDQVKHQAADIRSPAARQSLLLQLYDDFFASAFPRLVEKHGIVYTPVEIVDFILHSVAQLLPSHFGKSLADDDVHVLDPFTGTGTFITRLLGSNIMAAEQLPALYQQRLHATEILLLPYYIAAVNIEAAFAQRCPELPYTLFPGILLSDTFGMADAKTSDLMEQAQQQELAENHARRQRQMQHTITVIVGNPPYSVGQKSANDNNQNAVYQALDQRIRNTYAKKSSAGLKKGLYDSYIRALRWASDRIDKKTGGIIGFVTNAGYLNAAAANGLRQCLAQEFSSLYIVHLRGDARTKGEQRRAEGGNIFDQDSRAPIAISILVKQPASAKPELLPSPLAGEGPGVRGHSTGSIYFYDIGDKLSREQKLLKIAALKNIQHMTRAKLWRRIEPDAHGDWLNQRQGGFENLLPMGDKNNKNKEGNRGIFENFSFGIVTSRDAWCNNPSRTALLENIRHMVGFYEMQRLALRRAFPDAKHLTAHVDGFIDTDPTKISWSHGLKINLARDKALEFHPHTAVPTLYQPFSKAWLYYDRRLNERVYQMPQIFPLPAAPEEKETTETTMQDGFLLESRIQNPESRIQNPESRIQNPPIA